MNPTTTARGYKGRSLTYALMALFMASEVLRQVEPHLTAAYPTLRWVPASAAGLGALYRAIIYWRTGKALEQ